jgi:hypothetical protein
MFAAPFRLCDSHIFRRQPESTGFKLSGRLQAPGAPPPIPAGKIQTAFYWTAGRYKRSGRLKNSA